ncbi:MAG: glycosyl transferase family 4 [Gammaproteobacteria bacterium]|jgi:Fuc2NAc and GlcNAc transferase|nr:glycosyl transferase family 4 [Gammaproteobacteria bacterium]
MLQDLLFLFIYVFLFLASVYLCHFYTRYAARKSWLDLPNQRSSHTIPTPRGGGLVFILLWSMALLFLWLFSWVSTRELCIILPGTLIVTVTGFLDDRYSIRAKHRALLYTVATITSLYYLEGFDQISLTQTLHLPLFWVGPLFAFLAVSWSVNLFNFMDGMDGIAAVEALFILLAGGTFLWLSGAAGLAFSAFLLSACIAGFLVWNKPPAKLFMGDVGSATLGFIILLLSLIGEQLYGVSFLLWMILYMAFLVDATLTLLRRVFSREKWYEAHRLHAYQRLHQAGWSHKRVLLALICVNLLLSILAFIAFFYPNLTLPMLLLSIFVTLTLYLLAERVRPMF